MSSEKVDALDIAEYFLACSDEKENDKEGKAGNTISNLALQKLIYYAQEEYVKKHKKALYSDRIEAWEHGPVIPKVYREFKHYGQCAVDPNKTKKDIKIGQSDKKFLDDVFDKYGQYAAWTLRNKTHKKGTAWSNVTNNGKDIGENKEISIKDIEKSLKNTKKS